MPLLSESGLRSELARRRDQLEQALRSRPTARLHMLLQQVDRALGRVESGVFGVCEGCRGAIEESRLGADPLVRFCLDCLSPAEQLALEHDLELATRVQRMLLPPRSVTHGGWEAHYHYEPLGAVSGDHCDLILPTDAEGDVFFTVGDVSGKGVAASILMAHLQAAFRGLVSLGLPLAELLRRANHLLAGSTPANCYATLVCGRLTATGGAELGNAGHCPALLRIGGEVVPIEATGLPLGLFSDGEFETRRFTLTPGDLLLLYTDGLIEGLADGPAGCDLRHLTGILARADASSPRQLTQACLEKEALVRGGAPRSDDLTLMTIRRVG